MNDPDPTTDEDRRIKDELQARLNIATQHVEGIPEYTPDLDHVLARALTEATHQFAIAWAKGSVIPCDCGKCDQGIEEIRNVLIGILIPNVVVAAEAANVEVTLGDLIRMAGGMADKMFRHARASIGQPL